MNALQYIFILALFICPQTMLSYDSTTTQISASVNEDDISSNSIANDSSANKELLTFTVKGVTFNMILVKGGTFVMGATPEQGKAAKKDEKPSHKVTLSDYYIGETEVSQALYEAVMGKNPSDSVGADLPVESLDGGDCDDFAEKLSELTGRKFRLPTEAEWEYAARGGNKSKGYKYAGTNNLADADWGDDDNLTHPVKGKTPNELGIYYMSGNVFEYCADDYAPYKKGNQTNPKVEYKGTKGQVIRGGRVSERSYTSGYVFRNLGFRIVMVADK